MELSVKKPARFRESREFHGSSPEQHRVIWAKKMKRQVDGKIDRTIGKVICIQVCVCVNVCLHVNYRSRSIEKLSFHWFLNGSFDVKVPE